MTLLAIAALVFLLLLNAFFVLAEFAAVKIRGTQIAGLKEKHPVGAAVLERVHEHLDEYLSVCQLGITFASIGLGFVGEPALAHFLQPLFGSAAAAHAIALTASYIAVSGLHILLGEQVPKIIALTYPERAAILTARGLRFSHWLLFIPLWGLNGSVRLILRLFGLRSLPEESAPSEAEVRLILDKSQQEGLMPLRRLLLIENVFDFSQVKVRDEMRALDQVTYLHLDRPWPENRDKILATTFSRYPLFEGDPPRPIGIVHLKDLLYKDTPWPEPVDLRSIARKTYLAAADLPLEQLLTELRKRRVHMALVQDGTGRILGMITLEDVLEQLVGAIEDEFERDTSLRLSDCMREDRVLLDIKATEPVAAISEIINRAVTSDLGIGDPHLIEAVMTRERTLPTYLGQGVSVPHARMDALKAPCVLIGRSDPGVYFGPNPADRAHLIFVLLTPSATPRAQVRLLARIASLRESDIVWDRVREAPTATALIEAIRGGEELAIG